MTTNAVTVLTKFLTLSLYFIVMLSPKQDFKASAVTNILLGSDELLVLLQFFLQLLVLLILLIHVEHFIILIAVCN